MRIQRILLTGTVAMVLCAAPSFAATNLLTNANFNTDRSGWTDPPPNTQNITTGWNRDDARGSATSGSFAVTNNSAEGNHSGHGPTQCVNVTAGSRYDLGGKIEVPGSQQATGAARVYLKYMSGANCSGTRVGDEIYTDAVTVAGGRFTPVAERNELVPAGVQSALVWLIVFKNSGTSFTAQFDDIYIAETGGCVPSSTVLCLDGGRFAVSATFAAPGASSANAKTIALTDDTGYLWFFSENNVEVTAKVLNACTGSSGYHWVFVSGLTNVLVNMTVKDTQNGTTRTYTNPQGTFFQPNFDTSAFVCP